MWPLAFLILALGVLALRGVRWGYAAFVVLGLLYFPAKVGFSLNPRPCQLAFDLPLAVHSMTNYAHVVLLAIFFVMTKAQFRSSNRPAFAWSAAAALGMGALVEVAQGVTGEGHCRLRDLIPDSAGILVGAGVVLLLQRMGWRPSPTWSLFWWRDARQRHAPDATPRGPS
ncbi:MAG TPA: VanZ family protein [Pyrinomonadaceae bacterium]|jgi:hypothetical protein